MYRRRPFREPGRPRELSVNGTFHIDQIGPRTRIHTNWSDHGLCIFTYDAKLNAVSDMYMTKYQSDNRGLSMGVTVSGSTIYAMKSEILVPEYDQLVVKYDFVDDPTSRICKYICDLVYHPLRSTYIVSIATDEVAEINTDFKFVRYVYHNDHDEIAILPSKCSTNIYIAWGSDDCTGLSVIHNGGIGYYPICDHSFPNLLERPEYPDIPTMLHDTRISMVDLWHASGCVRSYPTTPAAYGVYIDSNTCVITSGGIEFGVFDHRYGQVSNQLSSEGTGKIWYVDGRLYVNNSKRQLCVID